MKPVIREVNKKLADQVQTHGEELVVPHLDDVSYLLINDVILVSYGEVVTTLHLGSLETLINSPVLNYNLWRIDIRDVLDKWKQVDGYFVSQNKNSISCIYPAKNGETEHHFVVTDIVNILLSKGLAGGTNG